ncbi:MAG: TylF/MycF/NovP-related O-methyltransferase [Myxococcota bacterium]
MTTRSVSVPFRVLQDHWRAVGPLVFDKRAQQHILDEEPRSFPSGPDGFREAWHAAAAVTPMDPWRMASLARRLAESVHLPGDVIECGVWLGGSAIVMGQLLKRWGVNKRLVLLDSFKAMPGPNRDVDKFYGVGWLAADENVTRGILHLAGVGDMVEIIPGWFRDTLPGLRHRQFCLAHLDADMYEGTRTCFEEVVPRLSPGGAVVVDDCFDARWTAGRAVVERMMSTGERLYAGAGSQAWFRPGETWTPRGKGLQVDLSSWRSDASWRRALKVLDRRVNADARASARMTTTLTGR